MCTAVGQFVKTHQCLCVATLGLAVVAYLGYRLVVCIGIAMGLVAKVDKVAKKVFDEQLKTESPKPADVTPSKTEDTKPTEPLTQNQKEILADKMIEQIYAEYTDTTQKAESVFNFVIPYKETKQPDKISNLLCMEYQEDTTKKEVPLREILAAIHWHKLSEKWQNLSASQYQAFFKKAIRLNENEFVEPTHPFIGNYVQHHFRMMNQLIRDGRVVDRDGSVVDPVDQSAKEIIFMCCATSRSLASLPCCNYALQECHGHNKVRRFITLQVQKVEDIYKTGEVVTERAFMSTTFSDIRSGNVRFEINRAKKSKGKEVEKFQTVSAWKSEAECLFPPFTKFLVNSVKSDSWINNVGQVSGVVVQLQEVEEEA
jgi:hypothetical protein